MRYNTKQPTNPPKKKRHNHPVILRNRQINPWHLSLNNITRNLGKNLAAPFWAAKVVISWWVEICTSNLQDLHLRTAPTPGRTVGLSEEWDPRNYKVAPDSTKFNSQPNLLSKTRKKSGVLKKKQQCKDSSTSNFQNRNRELPFKKEQLQNF